MKTRNIYTNYLIFAFLIIFIGINSCGDKMTIISYKVINNSDYTISIDMYALDSIVDTLLISQNNYKEYRFSSIDGGGINPFVCYDSLLISFNDSIKIKHYRDGEQQLTSRSLMIYESWDLVENNEERRRYEYIFTNDDYQEALNQ